MNKEEFLKRYEEWGIDQQLALHFRESQVIRLNPSIINPKKCLQRLDERKVFTEKVEFLSFGYKVQTPFPLASMIEYLLGYMYIQETSAQLVGEVFSKLVKDKTFDDMKVLDMCASPGGKTTHLSQLMRNKGQIVALDSSAERFQKLVYNLERMRVQNVIAYKMDALKFGKEKNFDYILIDAPCSGNFTQEKNWFDKRDMKGILERQDLQTKLLLKAKELLKENGIIIYATCSLEKEENEDVIEYALNQGFKLIDTEIPVGREGLTKKTKLCKRFLPSDNFPGFFMGVLQRE